MACGQVRTPCHGLCKPHGMRSRLQHFFMAWGDERGDVPGWVLITLMTAGLVIVIWALAGPALASVFEQAIERVTSF